MTHLFGKFVWFEHISTDPERARRFYGELFGWISDGVSLGGAQEGYHMIRNGHDGIGGFRAASAGMPAGWMGYLSVPDVDAAAHSATQAGARLLMPPTDFAPFGRAATLADPGGATFSVWKSAGNDRPDVQPVAIGDWYWNELMAPDAPAALKFYESVFGYAHKSMDMGAQGSYYVLEKDGIARGGLMQKPMPETPVLWMPYVRVADCDAAAARAKSLGAQIAVEPRDIPEVGRFAICVDPCGACVGIIKGEA